MRSLWVVAIGQPCGDELAHTGHGHHRAERHAVRAGDTRREDARAAGQQRHRGDQSVRPATVAGGEQLRAVDRVGRVGDGGEESAEQRAQPHQRTTGEEGSHEQRRGEWGAHGDQHPAPHHVGNAASHHEAERRGRAGEQHEQGHTATAVAAHVVEITILEVRGRRHEQVRSEGHRGHQRQPTALQRRCDAVLGGEPACFAEVAHQHHRHGNPHQREQVHEAPTLRPEVGELQRRHGHAGPQAGRQCEHAERVGAAVARHLLGGGHAGQQRQGDAHRPAECLRCGEHPEVGSDCPDRAHGGGEPGGEHDGAPASQSVGHHREGQREHHSETHHGASHALPVVIDAEVVGGERDRLGEQRVGEGGGHGGQRHQRQQACLACVELVGWCPPVTAVIRAAPMPETTANRP